MGAPRTVPAFKCKPGPAERRERLIDKGPPKADAGGAWEAAARWREAQSRAQEKDSGSPGSRRPGSLLPLTRTSMLEFPNSPHPAAFENFNSENRDPAAFAPTLGEGRLGVFFPKLPSPLWKEANAGRLAHNCHPLPLSFNPTLHLQMTESLPVFLDQQQLGVV